MEENPKIKISSYILASLTIIILSWGILWTGSRGLKLAFMKSHISYNLVSSVTEKPRPSSAFDSPISATENADTASLHSISNIDSILPHKIDTVSIIIGGDVMFDRAIRRIGERYGYDSLFTDITSLFKNTDIAMINLEGPITNNVSKTLLENGRTSQELTFTFATTTANTLKDVGISVVSLANNHTANFGTEGFKETKKWLSNAGVKWFGDPWNGSSTDLIIKKNNISVAFVGYHAFDSGFDRVLSSVKNLSSNGNFVIVMPHWGEEYSTSSSPKMRSQAKLLVDAGAGVIIGAHPHVILDREWIADVPVFYSIGNLLFDQYFSPEVMKGNMVELDLIKASDGIHVDKVNVYETSTASKRGIYWDGNIEEFTKPIDFYR